MYIFKIQKDVYHTVSSNCLWIVGLWLTFISLWVFVCNIWDILQPFFFRLLCKYKIFNKCFFHMQKNHKILLGFLFLIEVNIFNSCKRHIIYNLPFLSIHLVVLSTFTLLCNQTPGLFILQSWNPTRWIAALHTHTCSTFLLSVSRYWSPRVPHVFVFLWLAYFA